MITKVKETKDTITYLVDSIGRIEIKKNYKYNELLSYSVTKVRETNTDITYLMPDEMLCTVSKELQISIKEVIIKYYILKTFWDNNIYIENSKYQFRRPNNVRLKS